jgi:hypothetical protein
VILAWHFTECGELIPDTRAQSLTLIFAALACLAVFAWIKWGDDR